MADQVMGWLGQPWKVFSVAAQVMFFMRFFVQWLHSERQGRTVVPDAFWTFSIGGGGMLLVYCLHQKEWVLALGQLGGLMIYLRNFWMIRRNRARGAGYAATAEARALVDDLKAQIGKLSDINDRPVLVDETLDRLKTLLQPAETETV